MSAQTPRTAPARPDSAAPPAELLVKARRTGRVLSLERLTRRFWPLWTAALFGLALTLAGFWGLWSPVVRAGLLAAYGLLLAYMFRRGARGWAAPTHAEELAALDVGLSRRAATHLEDSPALGAETPMGRALWAAHRRRLEAEAARAKVPAPDLRLSAPDPWGLRYWALLALIGGFSIYWSGAREQVAGIFAGAPAPASTVLAAAPARLDAWINPPPYTRAAPIYLMSRLGQKIEVPTGSLLQFRVAGASETPVGELPGSAEVFAEDGPGIFALKAEILASGPASARHQGETLGSWDFSVIPDAAPVVEFAETPRDGRRQALSFRVKATDDYGVARAWVGLRAVEAPGPRAVAGEDLPSEIALEPDRQDRDLRVGEADLTEHPLVGLEAEAVAYAEDDAGNVGTSAPVRFKLPERIFSEPMAKAIVEQRRGFAQDFDYGARAQDLLEAAMDEPGDYFTDPTAYLAASVALHSLTRGVEEGTAAQARPEVLSLLWKSALRLEEGDLSNAWDALQAAKRRLEEALERGASDDEIARLTEEMRQAMNDYLDALSQMAERNPEAFRQQQQGGGGGETTREQLERMLRQMEQTARDGARDQAQEMLDMLAEMLENLRPNMQAGGSGGEGEGEGGDPQAEALQEMMRRQQELADETFQQGQGQQGRGQGRPQGQGQGGEGRQQGQRGGRGGQGGAPQAPGQGGLAERQGDLREGLGELGDLGEGERGAPLDRAREAMERAERALREGDSRGALDAQSDALEALREGARRLAEQRRAGSPGGEGESAGGESSDPFGRARRSLGSNDGEGVELPEERARNRALEVQREIRRRSSERERGLEELDYLNRLQRPF